MIGPVNIVRFLLYVYFVIGKQQIDPWNQFILRRLRTAVLIKPLEGTKTEFGTNNFPVIYRGYTCDYTVEASKCLGMSVLTFLDFRGP